MRSECNCNAAASAHTAQRRSDSVRSLRFGKREETPESKSSLRLEGARLGGKSNRITVLIYTFYIQWLQTQNNNLMQRGLRDVKRLFQKC